MRGKRGTIHRTINVRGRAKALTVERRAIEAKTLERPVAPISRPVAAPVEFLGPLAVEVRSALRERPMRFPAMWFRGGEA